MPPEPQTPVAVPPETRPAHSGENPRLIVHPRFHSAILPDDRDVIVYLPENYAAEPERRFPVLYLHDGQNLFDGETAYIRGRAWEVHSTADRLIADGEVEPLIIVGVYNTGTHRLGEYTPTANFRMGGGKAELYGQLLAHELKPFIDGAYRTLPDASHTGLGGSSLGGLVTLYLGLTHPEIWGKLAVLSPSIWWDNKIILSFVNALTEKPDLRIWLDMGTNESRGGLRDCNLLYKLLQKQGWREGEDLTYMRIRGGTHDEQAWSQRVGPFLKYLFPAPK